MQRVAIARSIVNEPDIILADEPTGALDSVSGVQVMELLNEISAERPVIIVTHNEQLAREYATRSATEKLSLRALIPSTNCSVCVTGSLPIPTTITWITTGIGIN